ncbi:hypoxanthine phosphoribosyltransferase [Citrobacter sp. NCU1]|uniref:phosphoribosyltransferase n=1 Tax=Citrobacter sp. NCU1 TaxID=2026683 RepID=UPI0018777A9B|nr:phosphoribosyltransferase family protein [Citrobacter sp. NCU1]NDO82047.1 hypoxanthine phosphoribosyltransferase [Citrobacter sp. NCU1]
MNKRPIGELVLSESQIKEGVQKVAKRLNDTFDDAVVITVVPGGILFTADLVRQLNFNVSMDYISCPHTPGATSNESEIIFHDNIGITGRNVLIIDDAIESGGTMKRLVQFLSNEFKPKSLSIVTLFVKPGRVEIPFEQYYAYEMTNDDLLIGYGLPWDHKYRNIPFISKLIK